MSPKRPLFKLSNSAANITTWNHTSDADVHIDIAIESSSFPAGVLIRSRVAPGDIFGYAPALRKYLGGHRILLSAGVADEGAIHDVVTAMLSCAAANKPFEMYGEPNVPNYIKIHMVLVLFGMRKEATALLETLWRICGQVKLGVDEVEWIWTTFGCQDEHVSDYSEEYMSMMTWQISNLYMEGTLDDYIRKFVDELCPQFKEALQKRWNKYGPARGSEKQTTKHFIQQTKGIENDPPDDKQEPTALSKHPESSKLVLTPSMQKALDSKMPCPNLTRAKSGVNLAPRPILSQSDDESEDEDEPRAPAAFRPRPKYVLSGDNNLGLFDSQAAVIDTPSATPKRISLGENGSSPFDCQTTIFSAPSTTPPASTPEVTVGFGFGTPTPKPFNEPSKLVPIESRSLFNVNQTHSSLGSALPTQPSWMGATIPNTQQQLQPSYCGTTNPNTPQQPQSLFNNTTTSNTPQKVFGAPASGNTPLSVIGYAMSNTTQSSPSNSPMNNLYSTSSHDPTLPGTPQHSFSIPAFNANNAGHTPFQNPNAGFDAGQTTSASPFPSARNAVSNITPSTNAGLNFDFTFNSDSNASTNFGATPSVFPNQRHKRTPRGRLGRR